MTLRRSLTIVSMLVVFAIALTWLARDSVLRAMATWLDVGQPPMSADHILVLAGNEDTRPFAAAVLARAGFAKSVLVTQTWPKRIDSENDLPPASELVPRVLVARGVARQDIRVLPGAVTTTYDEACALADYLRKRPADRVLVVTSGYHTRRARWIMSRVLADRASQVILVSAPASDFDARQWWRYDAGFAAIMSEYPKLAFYLIYYGRFVWWLVACAALAVVVFFAKRQQGFPEATVSAEVMAP